MKRNFTEQFKSLINEDVPRTWLKTDEEKDMPIGINKELPTPKDSFVNTYCTEK